MRESVRDKAVRHIDQHRLHIVRVDGDTVRARCRGADTVYELGIDGANAWCACPARRECAHLVALRLVATPAPFGTRQVAEARAHDRFITAGMAERVEQEPEWEVVGGHLVLDTCPDCGRYERVAVVDGLCPRCTGGSFPRRGSH